MADIDIETGLPRLPDGWRWEVREHFPHAHDYWGYYAGSKTYFGKASTKELSVRLSNKTEKSSQPAKRHWWSGTPEPIIEVNWNVKYTELTQGTAAVAVFNAANKIYNRWQADIDRRKLVGDYPPKKLER